MPAPTHGDIHAATETLARLTERLRDTPDPQEALSLVEPVLNEYTGLPIQLADVLRALARAVQEHPSTRHSLQTNLLIQELRTTAREQTDQQMLHYILDDLRRIHQAAPPALPECGPCP